MSDYRATFERVEEEWNDVPADLVLLRRVDSTNRLAREVANELARDDVEIHPTLFLAWEQSAGRGRHGRSWISPPALGIYGTLLIPMRDAERGQALPLVTSVSLCEVIDRWSRSGCGVEWPNDLMIDGRKVGGILIETSSSGDRPGYAALGFGINHGHSEGELPLPGATSIAVESTGIPPYPEAVAELTRHLALEVGRTNRPSDVIERFRSLSVHRQGDLLECRAGTERIQGRFVRFTDRGFLVLDTDRGRETLSAGEVVEE